MWSLYRRLAPLVFVLWFVGWIAYPGWYNEWYSVWPENYAWPASFSNQCDPPWGFWFW